MKSKNINLIVDKKENEAIPVIKIYDPYGYVESNQIIALLEITGTIGITRRKVVRTKKCGYLMWS